MPATAWGQQETFVASDVVKKSYNAEKHVRYSGADTRPRFHCPKQYARSVRYFLYDTVHRRDCRHWQNRFYVGI